MIKSEQQLTLIYPSDPYGNKVGGVESWIKDFISYAPSALKLRYIGISSDTIKRPPMIFKTLKIGNKEFDFLPLFYVEDENKKTLIPLSLKFTFYLNKIKHDFNDDVLFFHRLEPSYIFKNKQNIKLVMIHNDIEKQIFGDKSDIFWSKISFIYSWFEKKTFPLFNSIYSPSLNTIKYYTKIYPNIKEKFMFTPTFYSPKKFYPSNKEKNCIREKLIDKIHFRSKKWVLFVGRLQEQKSPLKLIEVLKETLSTRKDVVLIIIGEGDLKQDMIKLINKYNLNDFVYFTGYKKQDEILLYYQASDILILTSEFEGMPICMLEALGSGLPVLSTPVSGAIEIIKNNKNGELCDDFSVKNISSKLIKIIQNYSNYSKTNCLSSVKEYTVDNVLKSIYNNIINKF